MSMFSKPLSARRATSHNWTDPMKSTLSLALAATVFFFAPGSFAHDPAEHAKEAAAAKARPNCEALKTMDHAKMAPDDPVMKALMMKCAKQKPAGHQDTEGMDHSTMPMPATAPKKADAHGSH